MSTLNLLPFISTQNSLARREETIPTIMHANAQKNEVPKIVTQWMDNIEDYMEGIRLFGHDSSRKEDGYGERTYHFKDLEEVINVLRSMGLCKSMPYFMEDFKPENGWVFPRMETKTVINEEDGKEGHERQVFLGDLNFDDLYEGIKEGRYTGLDCVDYSGVIHRNCKLLKISDLHPDTTKVEKVLSEDKTKYIDITVTVPGVRSELYLILTPDCMENGYIATEEGEEPTLKASPLLRTPLGFITMRLSRIGEIKCRFPKGTGLLKSLCPPNVDYKDFDEIIAKATLIIQNTTIPGVIFKSIASLNNQAFLTEEHFDAHKDTLDYILSPEDEEDGFASVYKGWLKLTGQHHNFSTMIETVNAIFNARPKVIDDRGTRVGQDQQFLLLRVLNAKFESRWAVLEEFEAIINPQGYRSGTSSVTAPNPKPQYVHTLNEETMEWEKQPITMWLLTDSRGQRFFQRGEDPFALIDVNTLGDSKIKPLTDIYDRVKKSQEDMVNSLKKD